MITGPVFCINLKHRPDRWENVSWQLREFLPGLNFQRFDAIRLKPGWMGCRDSHLAIMEMCRDMEQFMVFEDDVKFLGYVMRILPEAMSQLPDDWEMLYLGPNFISAKFEQPLPRFSENLVRITQSYGTYAYIINNRRGLVKEILSMRSEIRKIDVFFADKIQPRGKTFATFPLLATQAQSYSDIIKSDTDYSKALIDSYNKNVKV